MTELLNEFFGFNLSEEQLFLFGAVFLLVILITFLKIIVLVISSISK